MKAITNEAALPQTHPQPEPRPCYRHHRPPARVRAEPSLGEAWNPCKQDLQERGCLGAEKQKAQTHCGGGQEQEVGLGAPWEPAAALKGGLLGG